MRPGLLGAPLAPLYAGLTAARRMAYDRGWLSSAHAGIPTFSVGALEAGGTGKTPIARWLLRELLDRGRSPGLLTRGYGRRSPQLEIFQPGDEPDPDRIGDEPALIARTVPVPIAAFGDRVAGARALAGRVDCLVLDDGFSHRRLARDLDIVVLRAEASPQALHHLPWGPLRESIRGLERADVFWLHGEANHDETARALPPGPLVVRSRPQLTGAEALGGQDVVLVTGIARPERVRASLEGVGVRVADAIVFPDHHRFAASDVERIHRQAAGRTLVCTAKDAVKLRRSGLEAAVVDVEVELLEGREPLFTRMVEPVFEQHCGMGPDNFP